ncbi:hypothetical protein HYPSUDRAFT_89638, partial [Hypholoma sublateritium FD-334 SS-4]
MPTEQHCARCSLLAPMLGQLLRFRDSRRCALLSSLNGKSRVYAQWGSELCVYAHRRADVRECAVCSHCGVGLSRHVIDAGASYASCLAAFPPRPLVIFCSGRICESRSPPLTLRPEVSRIAS